MGKSFRLPPVFNNILLLIGLAAIWVAFAPVKLGGQVSYAMVNGISMEPNYHTGDLIIVRHAEGYQVGDVVTYHDPEMAANIVHRIIALDNDRYVIQGDNNSWIDDYRPTNAEILGKLWIYLPKAALATIWIRKPLNMALVIGLLGGLFMVNMTLHKPNRKKGQKEPAGQPAGMFDPALYSVGGLAFIFLALSIFAFTRPLTKPSDKIQYKQTGTFSYSAAGDTTVYDTGAVRSGEPVFIKLTCMLNTGLNYVLDGKQLDKVAGTQQFDAVVQDDQTGWQRTIPLTSNTAFSGNAFTSKASMDLCKLEALVASVEQETGIRSNSYTLKIAAHVTVAGKISGQKFSDTFEPHLIFRFDTMRIYLAGNSQTDPLVTTQAGSLDNPTLIPNTLSLFGLKPTVQNLRSIGIYGLVPSLAGLLVLGVIFIVTTRRSQATAIRMKYGALLMDVYDRGLEAFSPTVDVATIENLAGLAERQNSMIIHLTHATEDTYLVQSGSTTYRYATGKGRQDPYPAGDQNSPPQPSLAGGIIEPGPENLGQSPSVAAASGAGSNAAQAETGTSQPEPTQTTRKFVYIHRQTESFQVEPPLGRTPDDKNRSDFHISDPFWAVLKAQLPKQQNTQHLGCHWLDVPDRKCADAIFYVLRTGCKWEELDQMDYCPAATAYERFQKWVLAGVFMKLWRAGGRQFDELKNVKGFVPYGNKTASDI